MVQLSRVDLLPGGATDDNLEGVKFVYEAGGPGSATLELYMPVKNLLVGVLSGQLVSEKEYFKRGMNQPERLSVGVEVMFQARRGAVSCQG